MQTLTAKDAKYNCGRLVGMARAEPLTVEKQGRAIVVVLAVEEYERLIGPFGERGNPYKIEKRDA